MPKPMGLKFYAAVRWNGTKARVVVARSGLDRLREEVSRLGLALDPTIDIVRTPNFLARPGEEWTDEYVERLEDEEE